MRGSEERNARNAKARGGAWRPSWFFRAGLLALLVGVGLLEISYIRSALVHEA